MSIKAMSVPNRDIYSILKREGWKYFCLGVVLKEEGSEAGTIEVSAL